jgi:hypothetical protein
MTYRERITPWLVVRIETNQPGMQQVIVGRFRKRSDAEAQRGFLARQNPNSEFVIMFDLPVQTL